MTTATPSTPNPDAEPLERLHHLVQRAEKGDESAIPELRAALDVNPWVWERYGDLGQQAMAAWLQLICGPNLLLRESVERKVGELKGKLSGPEPSPLERLLVARVAACWLQVHYADGTYAQATGPQVTPAARQELMKRQESAQR